MRRERRSRLIGSRVAAVAVARLRAFAHYTTPRASTRLVGERVCSVALFERCANREIRTHKVGRAHFCFERSC